VRLPSTKGLDNHEMIDASIKVSSRHVCVGEEISLVDSNANLLATDSSWSFSWRGYSLATLPVADGVLLLVQVLKRGTFTSTNGESSGSTTCSNLRRQPARLANYPDMPIARREMEYQHPSENLSRDRFVDTFVRRRDLRQAED